MADRDPESERVLVLAPTGRDAETVRAVLDEAGIASEPCADVAALCRGIEQGAGAVLVAEEALSAEALAALNEALAAQASWSDLPIVLVTGQGEHNEARTRVVKLLEPAGNVAILERPFRKLTLVTVFEAALRARRRQYQMRDATGELVHAAEVRAQAETLRQEAALRERFIGVLAHDLRTPLQAVAFSAYRLANADLPRDKVRECAERIRHAAERMTRLISDLLDLTRSRHGGGIPIDARPSDLAVIVRRAIDEIHTAHPHRRIDLACYGDTRGLWDEGRLSQVVSNLCGNAVAYSPPDTAVAVTLRAQDGEVALSVANRGDPIPEDALATLFDPFKRSESTGRRARQGLGLGLFIADRIVRAHGGSIAVDSTAEEGTTFTVTLPRRPAHAPAGATEPRAGGVLLAEGEAPEALAPCEHGRRVLVVEDDEVIRDVLREVLEDEGYTVVTAENGREALDLLSKGSRPCVVLLDLMMPVMNGWQMLEVLRTSGEIDHLRVVVVSAATGACEPPEGARRCLPKPINLGSLLAAIAESCH